MNRIVMFAALMLSVLAGLWVISSSAPLAAQTTTSATRSFISATVEPDTSVTVTIAVANYGPFGSVTETLPSGFVYVSSSLGESAVSAHTAQDIEFTLFGETSFTYIVTASSTEESYSFVGFLTDSNRTTYPVDGDSSLTVSADTPDPTPEATPDPTRRRSLTLLAWRIAASLPQ